MNMTWSQWKAYLANNELPRFEKLPQGNPDDFIVWGDGEFDRVFSELHEERKNPPIQFERLPDEGLL
jgi:hypothetical protein